jgi:hypothetical protein
MEQVLRTFSKYLSLLRVHIRTNLYLKRDDFNIPFICSNIQTTLAYSVYLSQFIRYTRACSCYHYILNRWFLLNNEPTEPNVIVFNLKLPNFNVVRFVQFVLLHALTFLFLCSDVRFDFPVKTMFWSSMQPSSIQIHTPILFSHFFFIRLLFSAILYDKIVFFLFSCALSI